MPASVSITANIGDVVINEVQYDPIQSGIDTAFEWVELYNRTEWTLDLTDWKIIDNSGDDCLSSLQIPPAGFLVIAAGVGFYDNFQDFTGDIAFITDGMIGNGLNNNGDRLSLIDSDGVVIDSLSYGDDAGCMSPPCKDVNAGHSLERQPAGLDTNRAVDFVDNGMPSPGCGLGFPTVVPTFAPTLTPTHTPTPNLTYTPVPLATLTPTPVSSFIGTENTTLALTATPTLTPSHNYSSGSSDASSPTPTSTSSVFTTPTPSPVQSVTLQDSAGNTLLYIGVSLSFAIAGIVSIILVYRVRKSR